MKSDVINKAKPGPTFDGESMRAILAGRKTQTRRVLKVLPQHGGNVTVEYAAIAGMVAPGLHFAYSTPGLRTVSCSPIRLPYRVGGVYYARESLCCDDLWVSYRGDNARVLGSASATGVFRWPWKCRVLAPHCMPRWAARVWLRITDVRVQRLGEATVADGIAEGLEEFGQWPHRWEQVNGKGSWERDRNKWVAAYTFEILKGDA